MANLSRSYHQAIESVKKHMGETPYCFSSKKLTLVAAPAAEEFSSLLPDRRC
jgi:hypothetical protein